MKSVIPAVGWSAVYEIDGSMVASPLVAWAVFLTVTSADNVEDTMFNDEIFGMVVGDNGKVVRADSLDGFKTYECDLDSAPIDYLAVNNGN